VTPSPRNPFGGVIGPALLGTSSLLLALLVYGFGAAAGPRLGEAVLFCFVVPLALGAGAWGARGGFGLGLLCAALAGAWWLQHGQPSGPAWLLSRGGVCIAAGVLIGGLIDSSRRLAADLAHHQELSLDLIVTASFHGHFTRVSPSVTRILGYSQADFLARPYLDLVHPDDVEATRAAVATQRDGNDVRSFQNRYRTKDGDYCWLEWTSHPDLAAGEMVAVARDISERKDIEARERSYQASLEAAVHERTHELDDRNRALEELSHELVEANHETLGRLALTAEYRDDDTHAHTHRVAETAAGIAEVIGLGPSDVELLREAALLHDIGKVGVPDAVLLKRGPLDGSEREAMKAHTTIGRTILAGSRSEILRTAAEISVSHHEWWDGSGYPDGLMGEQIPLSARIVAVADVFDALTHERPYKSAWTIADAVEEIDRMRGRQFDPQVVDAFLLLDHHDPARDLLAAVRAYSHNGARY
jgi:PAS domain S-box-containing protein/putative nucleotidyltransferase with HDIG domain